MPETPKEKPETEKEESDEPQNSAWSEDQKKREYYYDDAHGYEIYKGDEEDDAEERA